MRFDLCLLGVVGGLYDEDEGFVERVRE